MSTVFVYEYCCALGRAAVPASLYREGRAMRDAVAEDFGRVPGVIVRTFDDAGSDGEQAAFCGAVDDSDWSLVIAPETGRVLEERLNWVTGCGGKHFGPTTEAVRVCTDKLRTADLWDEYGVPTPETWRLSEYMGSPKRRVVKPIDGAGSEATFHVREVREWFDVDPCVRKHGGADAFLIQRYVPGRAASVAFLVGPTRTMPLPPTFQLLSSDGRFRYEGGELPIPPDLAARAVALGRRAIDCVPGLLGYVGVDLILGDAADGSADYAIEINPRLTTSYVGLRRLADFNLAEAMLKVATGEAVTEFRWKPGRVRFRPDGTAEALGEPGA